MKLSLGTKKRSGIPAALLLIPASLQDRSVFPIWDMEDSGEAGSGTFFPSNSILVLHISFKTRLIRSLELRGSAGHPTGYSNASCS